MITPLDEQAFYQGLFFLTERDPDLAHILETLGPPPMWQRDPGFATLVHIILEQQVSLASAQAAFNRLVAAVNPLTPTNLLILNDAQLKTIGFSRQKTAYVRYLALAILERRLDLDALSTLDDEAARAELIKLKGIGLWTADIYLLMALRRPDVWPRGDLALILALQKVKKLPNRPTSSEIEVFSAAWQPWRAVAARLLWHFYLS